MATDNPGDGSNTRAAPRWDDGGAYESYIGRWSRLIAREFLAWLDAPVHAAWMDVGCGSGALSQTILALMQPASGVTLPLMLTGFLLSKYGAKL